ncbi:MAG: signal peptide peptidase SppA [Acidobacteria bacterium]|nr:signal peptide peptidase SppA [Acidobacteriota bacterium]MBI3422318.1 signal peptide peptidase SppA [Acidobacteriota bacterium]
MKRSNLIWITIIGVVLLGMFGLTIFALMSGLSTGGGSGFGSGDRIAVIPVEGVIGGGMAKTVNRYLKQYGEDERIKAIILRIDSPGGGVSDSQEIYREVKRVKEEKKKKVIVSMGSVAASGGYYVACPADRIFANPGTITGSIGVIAEWLNYKELADWAKVKPVVFKTGEFKDTGSATREISDHERQYFQSLINEMFGQFVGAVAEGRKGRGGEGRQLTDVEKVKQLADGRVFTGETAKVNGLVDELGNFEDAVKYTAKLIGMKGEPSLVSPPKERDGFSLLDLLLGTTKLKAILPAELPRQLSDLDTSVRFRYQMR